MSSRNNRLQRTVASLVAVAFLMVSTNARAEGMNNLYAFVNGVVNAPADPVIFVVSPPEDYEELPYHQVTSRIIGLPAGILMMTYRLSMAVFDLIFFPFWVFPVFSPEPYWALIPDVEYET
jgi:hypothetical protein